MLMKVLYRVLPILFLFLFSQNNAISAMCSPKKEKHSIFPDLDSFLESFGCNDTFKVDINAYPQEMTLGNAINSCRCILEHNNNADDKIPANATKLIAKSGYHEYEKEKIYEIDDAIDFFYGAGSFDQIDNKFACNIKRLKESFDSKCIKKDDLNNCKKLDGLSQSECEERSQSFKKLNDKFSRFVNDYKVNKDGVKINDKHASIKKGLSTIILNAIVMHKDALRKKIMTDNKTEKEPYFYEYVERIFYPVLSHNLKHIMESIASGKPDLDIKGLKQAISIEELNLKEATYKYEDNVLNDIVNVKKMIGSLINPNVNNEGLVQPFLVNELDLGDFSNEMIDGLDVMFEEKVDDIKLDDYLNNLKKETAGSTSVADFGKKMRGYLSNKIKDGKPGEDSLISKMCKDLEYSIGKYCSINNGTEFLSQDIDEDDFDIFYPLKKNYLYPEGKNHTRNHKISMINIGGVQCESFKLGFESDFKKCKPYISRWERVTANYLYMPNECDPIIAIMKEALKKQCEKDSVDDLYSIGSSKSRANGISNKTCNEEKVWGKIYDLFGNAFRWTAAEGVTRASSTITQNKGTSKSLNPNNGGNTTDLNPTGNYSRSQSEFSRIENKLPVGDKNIRKPNYNTDPIDKFKKDSDKDSPLLHKSVTPIHDKSLSTIGYGGGAKYAKGSNSALKSKKKKSKRRSRKKSSTKDESGYSEVQRRLKEIDKREREITQRELSSVRSELSQMKSEKEKIQNSLSRKKDDSASKNKTISEVNKKPENNQGGRPVLSDRPRVDSKTSAASVTSSHSQSNNGQAGSSIVDRAGGGGSSPKSSQSTQQASVSSSGKKGGASAGRSSSSVASASRGQSQLSGPATKSSKGRNKDLAKDSLENERSMINKDIISSVDFETKKFKDNGPQKLIVKRNGFIEVWKRDESKQFKAGQSRYVLFKKIPLDQNISLIKFKLMDNEGLKDLNIDHNKVKNLLKD